MTNRVLMRIRFTAHRRAFAAGSVALVRVSYRVGTSSTLRSPTRLRGIHERVPNRALAVTNVRAPPRPPRRQSTASRRAAPSPSPYSRLPSPPLPHPATPSRAFHHPFRHLSHPRVTRAPRSLPTPCRRLRQTERKYPRAPINSIYLSTRLLAPTRERALPLSPSTSRVDPRPSNERGTRPGARADLPGHYSSNTPAGFPETRHFWIHLIHFRAYANRATGLLGDIVPGEGGRRRTHGRVLTANSTIQRRSPREDCAGRMDGWTTTTTQTTRQSTTVHDSSMEVSGSGSRRDRPTALDRPIATTDRPPRPPRPTASTALDRPRPPSRRVEWTTGPIEGAQCATDGRMDGWTDGRTDRTDDRTNERTD